MQAPEALFHGSKARLEVGAALHARRTPNGTFGKGLETFVESLRPPKCSSRLESFYMVDDPRLIRVAGGVQNFIYRLEPFGMFSKHNQGWLSRIYDALIYHFIGREVLSGDELHGRLRAAEAWAWKYWDGSPCPDLRPPNVEVWEYLASDVLVVACEYNGEWWSADIEEE